MSNCDVTIELWEHYYWEEYKQGLFYRVLWTNCDDDLIHGFFATQEEAQECVNFLMSIKWYGEIYDAFNIAGLKYW